MIYIQIPEEHDEADGGGRGGEPPLIDAQRAAETAPLHEGYGLHALI